MKPKMTLDDVEVSPRPWRMLNSIQDHLEYEMGDKDAPSIGFIANASIGNASYVEVASMRTDLTDYGETPNMERDGLVALRNAEFICHAVNHFDPMLDELEYVHGVLSLFNGNEELSPEARSFIQEAKARLIEVIVKAQRLENNGEADE